MQKRCLTCRKVPEKSVSEGERKDSREDLPCTTTLSFFAAWALGGQGDYVEEKDDSVNLCNLVYLISGISNMCCLHTWKHHIRNGVDLK